MILSFADKHTEELYIHEKSRHFPAHVLTRALDKLRYIDTASAITDLEISPGNRLRDC